MAVEAGCPTGQQQPQGSKGAERTSGAFPAGTDPSLGPAIGKDSGSSSPNVGGRGHEPVRCRGPPMRGRTRFHMRGRVLPAIVFCVAMRLAAQAPPTMVYTES